MLCKAHDDSGGMQFVDDGQSFLHDHRADLHSVCPVSMRWRIYEASCIRSIVYPVPGQS